MAYDVTGKSVEQLAADQRRALSDDIFLGNVLGYDFQEDIHRDLFAEMPMSVPGKALTDFREDKNNLILWPRGHFKTSATVVRIIRIVLNMPDVRILLMSANVKLTKNWLSEIRSHFRGSAVNSGLLQLFGSKWKLTSGNALAFTVPTRLRTLKDPTVAVATPNSVATGAHCDFFFADDLVNTKNYRNIELQDKLEEDFSNFVPLLDPGGYTCVTGTRYAGFDVYGRMVKKLGRWKISVKESRDVNRKLLFPQRELADGRKIGLTNEFLDAIEKDDPVMYNAQYMNRILAVGRQTFPIELIYGSTKSTKDAGFPANGMCFFAIDLAPSAKAESDNSVIAIGKRDGNGAIWIEDVVGETWTPSQFAIVLINLMVQYRPERIFIPNDTGAAYFVEFLRTLCGEKGVYPPLDLVKSSNTKDAKFIRISSLESAFRNKRAFLCASIRDFDKLEEEFTQFPKGRRDDRPDAIALLVNHLNQVAPVLPRFGFKQRGIFEMPDEQPQANTGSNMLGDDFCC
jgi:hypothetical protein